MSKYGFFPVCIFSRSNWIRKDSPYLSVFSPNAGKYRPEKTPYLDTFHAVMFKWIGPQQRTTIRYCKYNAKLLFRCEYFYLCKTRRVTSYILLWKFTLFSWSLKKHFFIFSIQVCCYYNRTSKFAAECDEFAIFFKKRN